MALIHWWPLNGDTQDKITRKSGTLINGGVVNGAGKIGQCYSSNNNHTFTSASWSCADGVEVLNSSLVGEVGNEYSFACWFKVHGTHGQYQCCIMSSGDWNTGNCWVIGFNQSNTAIFCPVNNYNKGQINLSSALNNNQWYHLATVYKNGVSTAYLNGTKIGEVSAQGIYQSSSTTACIGRDQAHGGFFPFNGDINDLRIYDHALSQAEVKELSKALVLHYTFNDTLAESTTNIISGIASAHGKASLESGKVKINWSPSTGDSYFMFNCTQTIKANSVYTLSFDCEGLKSSEVATFAVNNLGSTYTVALKNGRNSLTFTAGSDLMDAIVSANNYLFFDDKTSTVGAIFYLSNFQLEEKDHATPYIVGTRNSAVANEAGYTNPWVRSNFSLSKDTVSGSYSGQISNTGIYSDICSFGWPECTAAAWVKQTARNSGSGYDDRACVMIGGYYLTIDSAGGVATYCYGKAASGYLSSSGKVPLNTWTHIAAVWDSTHVKIYINGVLDTTHANAGAANSDNYHTRKDVGYERDYGRQFKGLISDMRVYSTALSADEISRLYHIKAYVTDQGDFCAGEFNEHADKARVRENYVIECNSLSDGLPNGYARLEYLESNGNQFIDTGFVPNQDTRVRAEIVLPIADATQACFGCRVSSKEIQYQFVTQGNMYRTDYNLSYIYMTPASTYAPTGKIFIDKNKNYTNINNDYSHTHGYEAFTAPGNLYIFATNAKDKTVDAYAKATMKLYDMQIYDNGKLIRNYFPSINPSGVPGLYDTVNGVFYASKTSTPFIAGPVLMTGKASFLENGGVGGREIIEV